MLVVVVVVIVAAVNVVVDVVVVDVFVAADHVPRVCLRAVVTGMVGEGDSDDEGAPLVAAGAGKASGKKEKSGRSRCVLVTAVTLYSTCNGMSSGVATDVLWSCLFLVYLFVKYCSFCRTLVSVDDRLSFAFINSQGAWWRRRALVPICGSSCAVRRRHCCGQHMCAGAGGVDEHGCSPVSFSG